MVRSKAGKKLRSTFEMDDGTLRARQNVVHEIGLFQGLHPLKRAVILLEEGVEEFNNIKGITQMRFEAGK